MSLICCEGCKFWKALRDAASPADPNKPDAYYSDEGVGECHRHAPVYLVELDGMAHWPQTYGKADGCGDGQWIWGK